MQPTTHSHREVNIMNQFVFEARHRTVLLSFIALGVVCLAITFFTDDDLHTRFWTNYFHNTIFFTGLGFISFFVLSAFILAYAGWYVQFKRLWESFSQFLLIGMLLMIPVVIGVWADFHHLYHWADADSVATDSVLNEKSSFLNPVWYTFATFGFLGVWYFFYQRFRALSLEEDCLGAPLDFSFHRKQKFLAGIFLPIAGFSSAALIWQWMMSIDAHWYSTLYAWYTTASWFVSAISLTMLVLIFLKSKGYYEGVTDEHLHDLGKYMFAFSIFWTYLWFSQYMLIWYANVGEETVYFQLRQREYPVLFFGNLVLNFVVPFFVLMRNDTKRKIGTLALSAGVILFGHWIDFFQMIKPGALHTAHELMEHAHTATEGAEHAEGMAHGAEHASSFLIGFTIPGLLEIGTMLGFLALFLYVGFSQLAKAPLIPRNDPYLGESLHHHV